MINTPDRFTIYHEGLTYHVFANDHTDQVFYDVVRFADTPFTIGIVETGRWEATSNVDRELVREIGRWIDDAFEKSAK